MAELRRGAVRLLLRQRRFDAALRHAGRRLSRAHRRPRHRASSSGRTSRRRCAGSTVYGDRDGDGFVEYGRQNARRPDQPGLEGQPRLDLPRRRHAGRGPIALVEVQAYAYGAWRAAAAIARRARARDDAADALTRRARRALRERFDDAFWSTRRSAPTCWRSTATSGPAGCAPPTPGTRCSPASPGPSAPSAVVADADAARLLLRLGHPHGRRRPRRATTR